MTLKLLGIIALMWILQGVFSYFQIKNLQNKLKELKKKGRVGLGSSKGRFSPGCIVIIAVDKDGKIAEAYKMSGMSVFARFKEFEDIKGLYLNELAFYLNPEESGSEKKAIESAIKMLETHE
ncbi:glucitol operon activator protein [Caldanaerovirga acetigignens]|uniref:Glucitol operon activator protein n=1 Tax=Caldanaerovirga acetigignens TaxID=447595 RepID=A0A1M7MQA5_9FIRM|nr:transcriptional regulator GutM [Caldanaerovirga acetigignens]SHM92704.1 glucitol operon activator protein [Caldanaerovirga acetigignens]